MDFTFGHFPSPNFSNYTHVIQDAEESGLPDNNLEENKETSTQDAKGSVGREQDTNRIYLDLIPVRSFLHSSSVSPTKETHSDIPPEHAEDLKDSSYQEVHIWNR